MPIGVICNALAVAIGGLLGNLGGRYLSDGFQQRLTLVFGCCSLGMGIASIPLMQNMPAVIFAVIVGSALGMALRLGQRVEWGAMQLQKPVARLFKAPANRIRPEEYNAVLVTIIVLFCTSSTGIYGAMDEGMSGDHAILLAKSVLDLFTALIFGGSLGAVVAFIALPQCALFMALYCLAGAILPLTNAAMIGDFKACGGILLLATGLRLAKIKDFPVADMIPAMALVMPVSWLWQTYVTPLIG